MSINKIDVSTRRKLEDRLAPGPFRKFLNAINPMTSLGQVAGKDFHENSLTISLILLSSLVAGILSTVMFVKMGNETRKDQQLILAAMAISWFVFINFTFLVFEATRLFNIFLFVALIVLVASSVTNLDQNTIQAQIGISIIALATIPLVILSHYYLSSEGDDIVQLKTLDRERRNKEEIKKLLDKYKKEAKEEVEKELTEDETSAAGIKRKVGSAYIDFLIEGAKKNLGKEKNKEKEKKDKDKDKEKKEKKDKEDEE